MSDFLDRISKLSPKRLALLAVELHEKVEAAERPREREAIAVVGIGCRLPGDIENPVEFWELLREGRDAIREVPAERWDMHSFYDADVDKPGKISTRYGGFLNQIDKFDPAFFGISPREAQTMDPQQRLLLEVSWEALEHAGMSPERLAGSATGVFIGLCNSDHFQRVLQRGAESIDAYLASGNAHSVAAGRISYYLGFQGPAVAIDTACSSSLVALHLACQSLRSGETRMVLAGGVNIMCSPETTIALTKAHMLAPDGRCKAFDAAADGFSRGEGCGVVVLKRLSDAVADGDRVLALIRGTASNQDGRSGGLTVPNGPAQEAVIRAALADAGLQPADIGYVEAHGTGTSLGDPIELRALAGALGPGRAQEDPLIVGSVKTNLGHLESAAGVAGIIKVVLSLQHERIPAHLHFREPSPHIAWERYPVSIAADGREWPRGARRRLAGVSSFGFSGTNAHVILEEAPLPVAASAATARPLHCLPLSTRGAESLKVLARRYADVLTQPGTSLADVTLTAGAGRSHFSERLAVVAGDAAEAGQALAAFAGGATHPAVRQGTVAAGVETDIVFLFTGQGSQYPGMSRQLYEIAPVFRDVIDRCDALLGADAAGRTLKTVLLSPASADQGGQGAAAAAIHETSWTQPALFAVEYALTQLWRSWGITPAAVIGHSVGEYIAACVAGVFSLEEGLRLIAERGRLMQALPPGGSMAAIFAPVAEVSAAVAPHPTRVAIAAINAADSVVIAGESAVVESILADFSTRNVQGQRLFVSLAAHSPLVEPALAGMRACAASVTMRAPQIPVAWNVTGGAPLPGGAPDADYWCRHLREPVRFSEGITSLYSMGYRNFLEVGPHPTLIALAQRSLPEQGVGLLTSLRRNKDDWREMMTSLSELYVRGASVDWAGVDQPYGSRRITAPTYPFERRSFWIATESASLRRPTSQSVHGNRLLGQRLPTAVPLFETLLTPVTLACLEEHRVHGAVLVAGPVFMEMAQAATAEAFGTKPRSLQDFVIHEPLVLPAEGRHVQVHLVTAADGNTAFTIHSRVLDESAPWQLHVRGSLQVDPAPAGDAPLEAIPLLQQRLGASQAGESFYERLAALGIELGPKFRSLYQAHRRDGEALADVRLPEGCGTDTIHWAHPTLLDGALQSVGLALPEADPSEDAYLLTQVGHIQLAGPLPSRLWCHAQLQPNDSSRPLEWRADVCLRGTDGSPLGIIRNIGLRRASKESLMRAVGATAADGLFYAQVWVPAPVSLPSAPALLGPTQFVDSTRRHFNELAQTHGMSLYAELMPALDRLSAEHACAALRELGFEDRPGRIFSAATEAAQLRVHLRHHRLFARLLAILVEEGVLRRCGTAEFEVLAPLLSADTAAIYQQLFEQFGHNSGELSTLCRCAGKLAAVLLGEQDPLQLLFPGGSFAEARQLYVESPYARTYNGALARALQSAIAQLPASSCLRVLEIGAGTGGTTSYVLPLLPRERVEYTFTDLSPLFLERAAETFVAHPFVRYALLDIERDPLTQGMRAGQFDIVIAANVLHATADLRSTVRNAGSLLAPGGQLLLLEGVAPERWVDLTFGLTEGWWRFTDTELRPDYPLIDRDRWLRLLSELRFTDAAAIPDARSLDRGGSQQALIIARAPLRPRRWNLLTDGGDWVDALASRLRARGDSVTVLPARQAQDAARAAGHDVMQLPPADETVYLGALVLAPLSGDDVAAVKLCEELSCEAPLQWLAQAASSEAVGRIWLVTQGAQPAAEQALPSARWQAPLWGLGRVFALEHPARWGGLVDLPPDGNPAEILECLLTSFDAVADEDQTAWRDGARLAARLEPAPAPAAEVITLRSDATYLVTGGFGGLGQRVARWLVERGARQVALLGRHPDPAAEAVRALESLGARVICLAGDVGDQASLDGALRTLAQVAPPLRGILHAAADLSVAPIGQISAAQVRQMLRPKIHGTVLLERLTAAMNLDFTVYFSSSTALLGAAGFAHYAAANLFLDATARHANRAGRRVLSVNWGTWDEMRLASFETQRSYREGGLQPMPAQVALEALGRLLNSDRSQAMVAQIDWSILKPLHEARRARPFLSRLRATAASVQAQASVAGVVSLRDRLAAVPVSMRAELMIDFVRNEAATVLGLDVRDPVPLDTGLFDLGMDSLMSVELKRRLERGAGCSLPSTLTFNYPTVGALAAFIEKELGIEAATESVPTVRAAEAVPIALVAGELDELSDEELEARLMARLEQAR